MERIFKTLAFLLPGSYAFLWPRALNKVALLFSVFVGEENARFGPVRTLIYGYQKLIIYTSNGTYAPSDNCIYAEFFCVGGGGGGGGVYATTLGHVSTGGAGGGGAYSERTLSPDQMLALCSITDFSTPLTVTVGAAGTAGTSGSPPSAGGNGGSTHVHFSTTDLVFAGGGVGGLASVGSGVGSETSTGSAGGTTGSFAYNDLTINGKAGGNTRGNGGANLGIAGAGGHSHVGWGNDSVMILSSADGSFTANSASTGVNGFGVGGMGSINFNSQSSANGSTGTGGIVLIIEYLSA